MTATPPLAALLPSQKPRSADDILNGFLAYLTQAGIELYPAQEEAILELISGKHVVLNTPTGSGKSLVATALHFKAMAEGKISFYTAPIKALVNEKFFALCELFGPENVGMLTGDATINREAPILCCTAEILANLALREANPRVDAVVMDEFHYYGDKDRGISWQIPLLLLKDARFLLMSATLGDVQVVSEGLKTLTGEDVAVVRSTHRPVPLDYEYRETPLHETLEDLVTKGLYPVYLVNFTQRAAAEQAQNLMSVNFCTREEKEAIRVALFDAPFDTPYGKEFQRFLRHGIGLHHAGLLPKYRLLVEKLAQQGLLKVVSGTDTLGMGINIPLRTVLFTQLCKYDGQKTAILTVRDFHQISGRAGRKGFDVRGLVIAQAPEHVIENLRLSLKAAAGKKVVKKQPPTKGYVAWDKATFERLITKLPEPLESRFDVNHGLVLNLLQSETKESGGGYGRLVRLVRTSHSSEYAKRLQLKKAAGNFRTLREAGLVVVVRGSAHLLPRVEVSPTLQRDFSLLHTLSLYLLSTLEALDRTSETYALDVLSLVEAILENPDVVLYKQLDALKTAKMQELKAQGVEFAQRIEELEKLEWPKPNREFTYATFNEFAHKHPWVGQENIRPKSIARDLYERCAGFDDYIREYELQRSEGVLLRYLSQVYKTLAQTVPEAYRTEELEDEWESLQHPLDLPEKLKVETASHLPKPRPLHEDLRALTVRARGDLHRFVKFLSERRYPEALAVVRGDVAWTPEALEGVLSEYWAEHARMDTTPKARQPQHTVVREVAAKVWEVQHRIMDPEGHGDWMVEGVVDLTSPTASEGPLLQLRRIGI